MPQCGRTAVRPRVAPPAPNSEARQGGGACRPGSRAPREVRDRSCCKSLFFRTWNRRAARGVVGGYGTTPPHPMPPHCRHPTPSHPSPPKTNCTDGLAGSSKVDSVRPAEASECVCVFCFCRPMHNGTGESLMRPGIRTRAELISYSDAAMSFVRTGMYTPATTRAQVAKVNTPKSAPRPQRTSSASPRRGKQAGGVGRGRPSAGCPGHLRRAPGTMGTLGAQRSIRHGAKHIRSSKARHANQ